jgi:phenylacetate-CoA ligase
MKAMWAFGQSPIRSLLYMGEPMGLDFRSEVAATLGCRIHSFYGTTEIGGIAGECEAGVGCHFDPSLVCPTILSPQFPDNNTVQGEVVFTTLHFKHHNVVKYQVGDVLRITTRPCPCGEATPRLVFIERTHDSAIIAGVNVRYHAILGALSRVAKGLDQLEISLTDLPEDEGHTLLRISLPKSYACQHADVLRVLQHDICELDDLFRFGLVRFEVKYVGEQSFPRRKARRITDYRRYVGDGATSSHLS